MIKVCCFYLLLYCVLAVSQQRVIFGAPLAPLTGDVKATITACGKPTLQHPIAGDDEDAHNSWILYYQRQGVDLVYNRVNEQWQWKFAANHQEAVVFNDEQLLYHMPCMEKIVTASKERDQAAPAMTPAGAGRSENNSSGDLWPLIFLAPLIILICVIGAIKEWNRGAQAALRDVPLRCPYCGSNQVHAGERGFKLMTGFIGSGKVRLTCLRCARQFKPGRGD